MLLADAGSGPLAVGEALPAAAGTLLADLGVADRVPGPGHLPCHVTRSAWGSPLLASVTSIEDPHGPGLHLDRPLFDGRLRACARAAGAEVVEGTPVGAPLRRSDGAWSVPLGRAGRRGVVVCEWIVDATGRRAAIAGGPGGARRRTHDALVAVHVTLPAGDADTAPGTLVESTAAGWWYTAPLPAGRRLIAHFTDADLPGARAGDPGSFRDLLAGTAHVAARAAAHPFPRPCSRAAPPRTAPTWTRCAGRAGSPSATRPPRSIRCPRRAS